jgi:uncharacterized DUF497 family protein
MKIVYTSHAESKFEVLKRYGVIYTKDQIEEVVRNPDKVEKARKNRKIAQKSANATHLIRVIYEERDDKIVIITFYPARRKRYED